MSQKDGEIAGDENYYHSIAFGNRAPLSPLVDENNIQEDGMYFTDLGTLCPVRCSDIHIDLKGFVHAFKSATYIATIEKFNKQFKTNIQFEAVEFQ